MQFEAVGATWTCRLDALHMHALDRADGRGRRRTRRASRVTGCQRTEVPSPDGKLLAFVRDHNLWVRVRATGEQIQLSHDGAHHYDYATPLPSPTLMIAQGTENVVQTPTVFWSPDSTRIATYVMDQRNFPRLTMTQSAPTGPIQTQVLQLRLSASSGLRSAHGQARVVRCPSAKVRSRCGPSRSISCTTVDRRSNGPQTAADSPTARSSAATSTFACSPSTRPPACRGRSSTRRACRSSTRRFC